MALFKDLIKKWFYTTSSSAASSDARVALLTASGDPKGSDTMANLASVLGGVKTGTIPQNGDFNNYINIGVYTIANYTLAQTLSHRPKTDIGGGVLYVIQNNGGSTRTQVYYDTAGCSYSRLINLNDMSQSSPWVDMSYLKDYTSLSGLASALGGLDVSMVVLGENIAGTGNTFQFTSARNNSSSAGVQLWSFSLIASNVEVYILAAIIDRATWEKEVNVLWTYNYNSNNGSLSIVKNGNDTNGFTITADITNGSTNGVLKAKKLSFGN